MNVITYDVYKNTVKKHDGFNPVTSEKNYSKLQFRFRDDDDWINCTVITASFWISNDNIVKRYNIKIKDITLLDSIDNITISLIANDYEIDYTNLLKLYDKYEYFKVIVSMK